MDTKIIEIFSVYQQVTTYYFGFLNQVNRLYWKA